MWLDQWKSVEPLNSNKVKTVLFYFMTHLVLEISEFSYNM